MNRYDYSSQNEVSVNKNISWLILQDVITETEMRDWKGQKTVRQNWIVT